MTESKRTIFYLYGVAVGRLCGVTTARAKELSERPSQNTISSADIRELYKSLTCRGWKEQVGANWVWRDKVPDHTDGHSDEVALERTLAARDVALWGCQMSTSSGVEGLRLHRRRAIDLVRFIKPCHYAFVELKVGSDNPLYAAFEILGYALAYLHARTNGWAGTGEHNVFDAENIELTVLGPERWYKYRKRGADIEFQYKLDWISNEIARSLNDFVTAELTGAPVFTMKFRDFPDNPLESDSDFVQTATEIDRCATYEWWKN